MSKHSIPNTSQLSIDLTPCNKMKTPQGHGSYIRDELFGIYMNEERTIQWGRKNYQTA